MLASTKMIQILEENIGAVFEKMNNDNMNFVPVDGFTPKALGRQSGPEWGYGENFKSIGQTVREIVSGRNSSHTSGVTLARSPSDLTYHRGQRRHCAVSRQSTGSGLLSKGITRRQSPISYHLSRTFIVPHSRGNLSPSSYWGGDYT